MLELYQFEDCPFCRRVRSVLDDLEKDYIIRNVRHGTQKWQRFCQLNPNEQVPFLIDPDRKVQMDESEAIIHYLRTYYGLNNSQENAR